MAGVKIVLVGGGSVMWTPTILDNLTSSPLLSGSHITLFDIDAEALALTSRLAARYAQNGGPSLTFSHTVNRTEALEGADFVLVTISTGGLATMRHDLEIPERYGIFQTVGDTVGPGGLSRALRNAPVFLSLARAMEKSCPKAWMFNLSNPLSVLTRVVTKETAIRALGLCPGVAGVARQYAGFFGVELGRCAYVNSGIDHCAWFTEFVVNSIQALSRLREKGLDSWLAKPPAEAKADPVFGSLHSLRCGLLLGRQLGVIPAIGDRHMVEFFPTFVSGSANVERYGLVRTSIADRQGHYATCRADLLRLLGQEPHSVGPPGASAAHHSDDIAGWIGALSGGPSIEDNVNAPNLGQVPELPLGAVVETRGLLDSAGLHPLAAPLPEQLAAVIYPHVIRQELTVEAAVEGSMEKALSVLVTDPLVPNPETARTMLEEMMAANKDWLPQFRQ
jgi:alpha-galactosidase/6-phospho-beta-glucosidase family protein